MKRPPLESAHMKRRSCPESSLPFATGSSNPVTSHSRAARARLAVRRNRRRRLSIECLEGRRLLTVGAPELVSVNTSGTGTGDFASYVVEQSLSGDGRYQVFSSDADDLVSGDTNAARDVFLRDLQLGTITLVSRNAVGNVANASSDQVTISADGAYVAFSSYSTDLDVSGVASDNGQAQIYRWQRSTGAIELVSVNAVGDNGADSYSDQPSISGDGASIAYSSYASDLVTGITDLNGQADIFVTKMSGGPVTQLASRSASDSLVTANGASERAQISRDGTRVVYATNATDIEVDVTDINGSGVDLVVYDIASNTNHYVSVETTAPTTANGTSYKTRFSLSADGRYQVFSSYASDIVPGDLNSTLDVFIKDLQTGDVKQISRGVGGASPNSSSDGPVISANGEYVVFHSYATNLNVTGTNSTNGYAQVYRWQRATGELRLVSINATGDDGGAFDSSGPSISSNGQQVAFQSAAADLVTGVTDANSSWYGIDYLDVYLRDYSIAVPTTTLVSHQAADPLTTGNSYAYDPRISRDGTRVVYRSTSTDMQTGVADINGTIEDLIVYSVTIGINAYVALQSSVPSTANSGSIRTQQSLSADGRYEVFTSGASDLVIGDQNGSTDVFMRDLVTDSITLISKGIDGYTANSGSGDAVISADGEYVAFYSYATNLNTSGVNSTNGYVQVYRWHRATETTELVSVNQSGDNGGDFESYFATISGDGQRVAFGSSAADLISGFVDNNGAWYGYNYQDVYLRDFTTPVPTTILVSHSQLDASSSGNAYSREPRLSRDGARIVYLTAAIDLGTGVSDINGGQEDLMVFDIATGENHYASIQTVAPSTGNAGSYHQEQSLSSDGRYQVFSSDANDLVVGDLNNTTDVFLSDLVTGSIQLISRRSDGFSANSWSTDAAISANGDHIVFTSYATNLDVTGVPSINGSAQVYRWSRATNEITLISINATEDDGGNYDSSRPSISADGQRVAFHTGADNLVPGVTDANGAYYFYNSNFDVYVRDFSLPVPTTLLVSRSAADPMTTGDYGSYDPKISRDGSTVVFLSAATDLSSTSSDGNGNSADLFAFHVDTGVLEAVNLIPDASATGNQGVEPDFSLSDDGQIIAWSSPASDLHALDLDTYNDVYVRDLSIAFAGVELVSVDTTGTIKSDYFSTSPSLSGDGKFVAFESGASNLDPLATAFRTNVYVRDRSPGASATTLISLNAAGSSDGDDSSVAAWISQDGSMVAFISYASDLDAGVLDGNSLGDVYLRNWQSGSATTRLISRRDSVAESGNGAPANLQLSDDGSRLTYNSSATDLFAGFPDTNGSALDVLAFDGVNQSLVSQKGSGRFTGRVGVDPAFDLSDDANFLVFSTSSNGLVLDSDPNQHIYRADVTIPGSPVLDRMSRDAADAPGSGYSYRPSISGDGRYVAFESWASFDSIDTNGTNDIYLRDTLVPSIVLISVNASGTGAGDASSTEPTLSRDGTTIAFASSATDLDAAVVDNNSTHDVFLRNWQSASATTQLVSRLASVAESGNRGSWQTELSDDGSRLVFVTYATDLFETLFDANGDQIDILAFDGSSLDTVTKKRAGGFTGTSGIQSEFDLSDDGLVIAFSSYSVGLVEDSVSGSHIYVRDESDPLSTIIQRISIDSLGVPGVGQSDSPSISGDGRYVAFQSTAALDPLDTNPYWWNPWDIYVHDRTSAATTFVSVNAAGTGGGEGNSVSPNISRDGAMVAFTSDAPDLDASFSDTNSNVDVFVRNWQSPTVSTTLVSRRDSVAESGNSGSNNISISDTGGRIVFVSYATNLLSGIADVNGSLDDLYSYDGSTLSTVTVKGSGRYTGNSASENEFDLSDNGSRIAFTTGAIGITADTFQGTQVYVRDLSNPANPVSIRVSVDNAGIGADNTSRLPSISGDGRYVAFESASALDPIDIQNWWSLWDIYVRDLDLASTQLVSINATGTSSGDNSSLFPRISRDGSTVAFTSYASDLSASVLDANDSADVFIRKWNAPSPVTDLVSTDATGTASGNNHSYSPILSENGITVVFRSDSDNLTSLVDTNSTTDIFAIRAAAIAIRADDANRLEPDAGTLAYRFKVTREWFTGSEFTLGWKVVPSGINPAAASDFGGSFPEGSLAFGLGEVEKSINILVSGDLDVEQDEGFSVVLFDSTNNSQIVGQKDDGTILNNDIDLVLEAVDSSKSEGNSGSTAFGFQVRRIGYTGIVTTADWVTSGNTSVSANAADFGGAFPSGNVSFAIGETVRPVSVSVSGDSLVERNEGFKVSLSNPSPNAQINQAEAIGSILNDDVASIALVGVSAVESTGLLNYTVTISNPVDTAVTVDFKTLLTGTALAGTDYTAIASQLVSFAAGTTTTQTVSVTVADENLVELDESVHASIGSLSAGGRNVSIGTSNATGTIANDDSASIALIGSSSNESTGLLTYTATLSNPVDSAVTVDFKTLTTGTALAGTDFTAIASQSVTFAAGTTTTQSVSVTVANENLVELDETVVSSIGSISAGGRSVSIGTANATGTIVNDDSASIALVGISASEATGVLNFTVTISNPVDTAVTVDFKTLATGTALTGTDFSAIASQVVTFSAGSTATQTVAVTVANENLVELDETVNSTIGSLSAGGRTVSIGTANATGTILNDDSATIALVGVSASEATGVLNFTVTISNPVDTAVTVDFKTLATGTALTGTDFGAIASQVVTFSTGSTAIQTVAVTVANENLVELDETVNSTIGSLSAGGRTVSIGTFNATGTILNDDSASIALVGISASEATGVLNFTVTISNPVDTAVTVDFKTLTTGTALSGTDFTAIASQLVTFAAGSTATQTVAVSVLNDLWVEPNETVDVQIASLVNSGRAVTLNINAATGTILNDDVVFVAGRNVFYNDSGFETTSGVAAALDSSKTILKANTVAQTTTSANVSSYSRGINGIVLDVAGLTTTTLATGDFIFRVAPSGATGTVTPSTWPAAPPPSVINVTPGTATTPARVRLEWPNNSIQNTWLQVIVLANANTGLINREVFYLGHALGDVDYSASGYRVSTGDVSMTRAAVGNTIVSVSDARDIDKDRRISTNDVSFLRSRVSNTVLLRNITVPAAGSADEGEGGLAASTQLAKPMEVRIDLGGATRRRQVETRWTSTQYDAPIENPVASAVQFESTLDMLAPDVSRRKQSALDPVHDSHPGCSPIGDVTDLLNGIE